MVASCPRLRLAALDDDDIDMLSAHLQFADVRVGDLRYFQTEKTFALGLKRLVWEEFIKKKGFYRRLSGLNIHKVSQVHSKGFSYQDKDRTLTLLALHFCPGDNPPQGQLVFTFAGQNYLRIDIDFIEVGLRDLDENLIEATDPTAGDAD